MDARSSVSLSEAPYPFNQTSADITLRTSDLVDFHVHTQILSQASPVFATMLELPQPQASLTPDETSNSIHPLRPVVDLAEDSKTLKHLLSICYPMARSEMNEPGEVELVMKTAIKYDMMWIVPMLSERLLAIATHYPLEVWAIGCRNTLEPITRRGAEAILDSPVQLVVEQALLRADLPAMDGVSAGHYNRLLHFLTGIRDKTLPLLTPSTVEQLHAAVRNRVSRSLESTASIGSRGWAPGGDIALKDLVCRCGDGKEIWAHQSVLALHSSVIEGWILAEPRNISRLTPRGTPILVLSFPESSEIIESMLKICHHDEDRLPVNLYSVTSLLVAAHRYRMKHVIRIAEAHARSIITSGSNPDALISSYFLVVTEGLATSAKIFAKALLGFPDQSRYHSVMEDVPANAYLRLLTYHRLCCDAACGQIDSAIARWENAHQTTGKARYLERPTLLSARMVTRLRDLRKHGMRGYKTQMDSVFEYAFASPVGNDILSTKKIAKEFYWIVTDLPGKIDEAIDQVELQL